MSYGWEIDPPYKAYDEYLRRLPECDEEPEEEENEPEDTDDEYDEDE